MSDQTPATTLATPNPAIANATQVLAIKELGDSIGAVKKQVRSLWIAFAVLAVVTVIVAAVAIGPRFGLGMTGNRATFQRGQSGTFPSGTNGPTGGTTGGPQQPVTQP